MNQFSARLLYVASLWSGDAFNIKLLMLTTQKCCQSSSDLSIYMHSIDYTLILMVSLCRATIALLVTYNN